MTEEQNANTELTGDVSVSVKAQDGTVVTLEHSFGNDVSSLIEQYGEAVVFSHAIIGMKTSLRNALYSKTHGESALSADAAKAALAEWKPSVAGARAVGSKKDPVANFLKAFEGMSDDAKAAMLAQLQASLGGAS